MRGRFFCFNTLDFRFILIEMMVNLKNKCGKTVSKLISYIVILQSNQNRRYLYKN